MKIQLQKYKEILDKQKDHLLNVERTTDCLRIQKVGVRRTKEVLTNKAHEESKDKKINLEIQLGCTLD